LNTLLLFEIKF